MLRKWLFILPIKFWISLYRQHFNLSCEISAENGAFMAERIHPNYALVEYPENGIQEYWSSHFLPMLIPMALFFLMKKKTISLLNPHSTGVLRKEFRYVRLDKKHILLFYPLLPTGINHWGHS